MDFLLLRSFDSYISASLTLARLDDQGIECYLKDEYTVTIDPMLSNAIGGIKLMVRSDDFEKASALLSGFDEDYRDALTCPQCSSHNVEYINKPGPKNWTTAVLSWFLASYAVATEQIYHCYSCGFEFENLPEETINE